MKKFALFVPAMLAFAGVVHADDELSSSIYRFINTDTGGVFLTSSQDERDNVLANYSSFEYVGTGFYASLSELTGLSPVFRFYNTDTGSHFYTINEDEKNAVIANFPSFNYEGIAWYASAGVSIATGTQVRIATFNASLNRSEEGGLISDLSTPDNVQAQNVAEIIQRVNPDVLLINEFDYDADSTALSLFKSNYLQISQNGQLAVDYPYSYAVPSNTGVPSGMDFNNDGVTDGADDAYGYGAFPGQYAFVILSKYPILSDQIRTFQNFLWQDMPDAKLPDDPDTDLGQDYYSSEELSVFRLSSKNHVDVPIQLPGQVVHVLAAHPTPPVYDGDEDRNGLRNFDEIRMLADYITPGKGDYLVDDAGQAGGLAEGASFVIMGDMNADPVDGDSTDMAIHQLLWKNNINRTVTGGMMVPQSAGGVENNVEPNHIGNNAFDTASWGLRADYVLPSSDLTVAETGIFWPTTSDAAYYLVEYNPDENKPGSSDHRLVWIDVLVSE